MKEYVCVEVSHYTQIVEKIKEYLENGWHLHTYQATVEIGLGTIVHFLLFEKG